MTDDFLYPKTPYLTIMINHGYEPQGKPWPLIPHQWAGYYIHAYAG